MSYQSSIFDYYESIIPAPNAFREVIQQPLPATFWVNTLKVKSQSVKEFLNEASFELKPLTWCQNAFRYTGEKSLGNRWEYLAGLYQIQEEVSMLPATILDPKPHERILDLCAAPGNKTAQISVAMQNTGTLVANDRNFNRMRAMGQISKRLGLINISLTIYDGVTYPPINNYFDKVLVDAPCSCEGTLRKRKNKTVNPNRYSSLKISHVQKALLKKAIRLCRAGGKIVYSTCTFAPEENERVVHEVVKQLKGQVRIIPIELNHFNYCEGLTEWNGEKFAASLKNTMRVWPHLNNTGGFYVALLEKTGESDCEEISKVVEAKTPSHKIQQYLQQLQNRFDFSSEILDQYQYNFACGKGFYFVNPDQNPPEELKIDATGLFFIKTKIRYPKLSTSAAMMLAQYAKQNIVSINEEQLLAYLKQRDFTITEEQAKSFTKIGYVLVKHKNVALGVGIYFPGDQQKPNRIRSLFPKYLGCSFPG